MSFRIRYSVNIDWVAPGMGPMGGSIAPNAGPMPGAGGMQTIEFQNLPVGGTQTATFLAADVTTLTNAMAADIAAQLNAPATLARIQAFATGAG